MFHVKHIIKHSEISKESLIKLNSLLDIHQVQLTKYAEELMWWNTKINLVSRDVSRETVIEHIRHSLLIHQYLDVQQGGVIIDTGTGGGLPGMPLAICFPDLNFVLNDIVSKKMMAIKQMAFKLGLKNVKTQTGSISEVPIRNEDLVITKHAFKIEDLISFIEKTEWRKIVFLKGKEEVIKEIDGVLSKLEINIIGLDAVLKSDFYKGKAIVEVLKSHE